MNITGVGIFGHTSYGSGSEVSFSLSGTFSADMEFVYSTNSGATWQTIWSGSSAITDSRRIDTKVGGSFIAAWKCDTYRSGTVVATQSLGGDADITASLAALGTKLASANKRKRTYCVYGDSRAALNVSVSGLNIAYLDCGFLTWAQAFAAVDMQPLGNDGVGGETTAQILARVGNVIEKAPDVCFYFGDLNDFTTSGSSNAVLQSKVATAIANITATFSALSAAGIYIVCMSGTGYSNGATDPLKCLSAVNIFKSNYFRDYPMRGRYVDVMSLSTDYTNGHFITSGSLDNIHPSNYLSQVIGKAMAPLLQELFSPLPLISDPNDYISTSINSNQINPAALMAGTAGAKGAGITGTVATALTAGRNGTATAVCSIVAATNFGLAQRAVITSNAVDDEFYIQTDSFAANLSVGDVITAFMHIKVASATNLRGIRLYLQTGNFTVNGYWANYGGIGTYSLLSDFVVVPQLPTIPVTTSGGCTILMYADFNGAGGATIDWSQLSVLKNPT